MVDSHHLEQALEHVLAGNARSLGRRGDADRHGAAPDAADPAAQDDLVAHGHGRQEVHAGDGGHHDLALCQAARSEKGRLGHELQALAREQRAVVVGQRGQYQFMQLGGSGGCCHVSQFTQNSAPAIVLKRRILAKRSP